MPAVRIMSATTRAKSKTIWQRIKILYSTSIPSTPGSISTNSSSLENIWTTKIGSLSTLKLDFPLMSSSISIRPIMIVACLPSPTWITYKHLRVSVGTRKIKTTLSRCIWTPKEKIPMTLLHRTKSMKNTFDFISGNLIRYINTAVL